MRLEVTKKKFQCALMALALLDLNGLIRKFVTIICFPAPQSE